MTGRSFLREGFKRDLFGPGKVFDDRRHFLIAPDAIGRGASSKPSDGLHAKFPRYGYVDLVEAQYRLVVEHLDVKHLRVVFGTSMGGMLTYLWGERHPEMMDVYLAMRPELPSRERSD